MSPTESRTGFRLPWSTDGRVSSEQHDAPGTEPASDVTAGDSGSVEPAGPVTSVGPQDAMAAPDADVAVPAGTGDAASTDRSTAEADPASIPDAQATDAQPDTEVQQVFPSVQAPADHAPDHAAPAVGSGAPQRPHRPEKFLAELTRAMQTAAEAARDQSLGQFEADSKKLVDEIQARSADEAAGLRQASELDVAATREWSKAEMARIREETDARIAERRARLDHDLEAHAELVEARIGRVHQRLEAYRAEMADFFEQLLAVDDPTRFATLAEQVPEPPTSEEAWLDAVPPDVPAGAEASEVTERGAAPGADAATAEPAAVAESVFEDQAPDATPPADDPRLVVMERAFDFGAAEAEARVAAVADQPDQGDGSDEEIPDLGYSVSDRLAGLVPSAGSEAEAATTPETTSTEVVVRGLVSVASIAGFKRQLARTNRVASVSVSSGPDGEFVFAVSHEPGVVLAGEIASFSGFEAQVTDASDGVLRVTARDPEA